MEKDSIFIVPIRNTGKTKAIPINLTNLAVSKAFKMYFDFCYFACLSPFRLKWNNETNIFVRTNYFPQKIICLFVQLVFIAWSLLELRVNYPKTAIGTSQIFKFLQHFSFMIFKLLIFKAFWFQQHEIVKLLNYIIQIRFRLLAFRLQKIIFHWFFLGILLLLKLTLTVSKYSNMFSQTDWKTEIFENTRAALFFATLNYSSKESGLPNSRPGFKASEYALIVFGCVTKIHFRLNVYISVSFLFLIAAALWSGASSFAKYLKRPQKTLWKPTSSYYKEIFYLSEKMNKIISFVPLWWLVTEIVYFANYMDALFLVPSSIDEVKYFETFNSFYWLVTDFLLAFGCGEICSKVIYFGYKKYILYY